MLDLEGTLVEEQTVFAHVPEALKALLRFETAAGKPLGVCLVSDVGGPARSANPGNNETIFNSFLTRLERLGLKRFFEPVQQRVTLSIHAGARKPHPEIFQKAIQRLAIKARLNECMLITDKTEHIRVCRQNLKMKALQFDGSGTTGGDCSDWLEVPLMASRVIAPESLVDLRLALNLQLETAHGLELVSITSRSTDGLIICGRARQWYPFPDPKEESKREIYVQLSVALELSLDKEGRIRSVRSSQPDGEALAEAAAFLESLEANQQIERETGSASSQTTHRLVEENGKQRLKRIRFNAA